MSAKAKISELAGAISGINQHSLGIKYDKLIIILDELFYLRAILDFLMVQI